MAVSFAQRFRNAWNIFLNQPDTYTTDLYGPSDYRRPDRPKFSAGKDRSIITSILNRIAVDVATLDFKHVKLDDNGRYTEDYDSGLNDCLTIEANKDQTGRDLILDIVISLLDDGKVAVVPVDTDINIYTNSYVDIYTMRTAQIIEWKPDHVKIKIYNDRSGKKEEVWVPKASVAIIENPFYSIFNEKNSTVQRLSRKFALLDSADEEASYNKLDLIMQLPYPIKNESKRKFAEERRKDIENQLKNSKYGVAYIDSTEHITQLNRSLENNLLNQIEYLTNLMFTQTGITQAILDGTADDKTMLNYYNRLIEPIAASIVNEFKRKFLTKTARTQGQTIKFFRDPFKLVPVNEIAEIVDKFTRNEIATGNEMRQIIGWKPSKDPTADELRNKNLSAPKEDGDEPVLDIKNQNNEEGGVSDV